MAEIHESIKKNSAKRHVFCIGCKGIPAEYGGFETFMENLTLYRKNKNLRYHVSRMAHDDERYEYNGAKCYDVAVPEIGSAKAILYDLKALKRAIRYCQKRPDIESPIFFIMACRIGPMIWMLKRQIKKLGGKLYLNPDGHDWARRKWSAPVRAYWKLSERLMVKHADYIICDSKEIEKYIHSEYGAYAPNTTFIGYGADINKSKCADDDIKFNTWLTDIGAKPFEYYLVVGRFVQENNFDIIIEEFMKTEIDKKLIILTTPNAKLQDNICDRIHFDKDERIIISDPIYDKELVKKIRENAFAYIHGHEVGGTNPSLLEALASTDVNLVLDVKYNVEVVDGAAILWSKQDGSLSQTIQHVEKMDSETRHFYSESAKDRIRGYYNWEHITSEYENAFLSDIQNGKVIAK